MRVELSQRGRAGAGVIRQVLDERALGAERPDGLLEPRMARLMRDAGLPSAVFQYPVHTEAGRFLARVDFAYVALRLAIEVDGYHVHGTRRAMEADFVRQNALAGQGWIVLRFTWTQVVRRPEFVARSIAEALQVRAA
jgi:very-short-patch-repair endonuclease